MTETRSYSARRRALLPIESLETRAYLSAIGLASHVDFPDGTAPVAIVAADFNNDGKMDIATADDLADKVNIFFGTGTGSFSAGPVLTLTNAPSSMIVGDFNGDGFPDLAVGSSVGTTSAATTVTVFLNTQNSSFGVGQITTIVSNAGIGDSTSMTTGDFNGDGNLDIATANLTDATATILLGTGLGTFAPPVTYPVAQNASAIVAGHFQSTTSVDLAVLGQRSAGQGLHSNVVSILEGAGDGTFTAGADVPITAAVPQAMTAADFNSDGLTDLAIGDLDDSVEILGNEGAAEFTNLSTVSTSGPVSAVAVSDLNFDGTLDLIAAQGGTIADPGNDNISVAQGISAGSFNTPVTFPTGSAPVSIAIADFNGDRKPDIAVANSEGGTVSVTLNTSAGVPQIATTTTLTSSLATAPFATNIALTATVTGPANSGTPSGNVNFYQGSTLLGSAAIATGTDTAVLNSTTLGVGTDVIIARYQGDGTFSASASPAFTETITPTPGNGPDLIATFISSTLPTVFVPGEKATVKFRITNQGNSTATGAITNGIYLSLDDTLDPGDIQLTVRGPLAATNLKLAQNKSVILSGTFTVPATLPLGDYHLLADVDATGTLLESDSTNNTGASPSTQSAVDAFGSVGGKPNVQLTLDDADGTAVTYKLVGPGTGTVNVGDDGIDVSLAGTTAASKVTITGKGGDGLVNLHDITANGAVGSITGATVSLSGDVTLSGGVGKVILADTTNDTINVGTGITSLFQLGTADGTFINSTAGIKTFSIATAESFAVSPPNNGGILPDIVSLTETQITAPWIGALHATKSLDAIVTLTGVDSPGGVTLGSALVAKTNLGWNITGNVGKISIADIVDNAGGVNVVGDIKTLSAGGTSTGSFSASNFGVVQINGDFDGVILAGANLGPDGFGDDDTFAAGSITSIHVTGSVGADSIIAAGFQPSVDSGSLEPVGALLPGGIIKSIIVGGTADPSSKFLAAALPAKVKIHGATVIPSTDPRFSL